MDLTEFGLDKIEVGENSGGGDRVKPGRYNFEYAGSEKLQNDKGWEGIQIHFAVEGSNLRVNYLFTMVNPNGKQQVKNSQNFLMCMIKAMGLSSSIKDTDELLGKKVEGELVLNKETGYLEIKDDYGNGWKPYGSTKSNEHANPKEVLPKDEIFPSDEDESDMPF